MKANSSKYSWIASLVVLSLLVAFVITKINDSELQDDKRLEAEPDGSLRSSMRNRGSEVKKQEVKFEDLRNLKSLRNSDDREIARRVISRYLSNSGVENWTLSDVEDFEAFIGSVFEDSRSDELMAIGYQCVAEKNPELAIAILNAPKIDYNKQQQLEAGFWHARKTLTQFDHATLVNLLETNPKLYRLLLNGGRSGSQNLIEVEDYVILCKAAHKTSIDSGVLSQMIEQLIRGARKKGEGEALDEEMLALVAHKNQLADGIQTALYRDKPFREWDKFEKNIEMQRQVHIDAIVDGFIRQDPELGLQKVSSAFVSRESQKKVVRTLVKNWLENDPTSVGVAVTKHLQGELYWTAASEIVAYLNKTGLPDQANEWRRPAK